jgi:hypothetical protein
MNKRTTTHRQQDFEEQTAQQFRDLWERTSELNADLKQVVDVVTRFAERQKALIQEVEGQKAQSLEMLASVISLTEWMVGWQSNDDDVVGGNALN